MQTKTLTQLPLGKLKNFIEEKFHKVEYSKEANIFFEKEFLGDTENLQDIIKVKDGDPDDVKTWLLNEFDLDMDLSGDYAIVAVLSILVEFTQKGIFEIIESDFGNFSGGFHRSCETFSIKNEKLFKLNIKNKDFELLISENLIDLNEINKDNLLKINSTRTHFTLPLVKYQEESDLTEIFIGSKVLDSNNETIMEFNQVKTLTLLDLGLDKVSVKQVAAVVMVMASCSMPDPTPYHTIKNDFVLYFKYKGKLIFASKMKKEDFIYEK